MIQPYNILSLATKQIEQEVRSAIKKDITKKLIDQFKVEVMPIIEEITNRVVIEEIQCLRDFETMIDNYHVDVKFNSEAKS